MRRDFASVKSVITTSEVGAASRCAPGCDLHVQVCNGELRHCGPGMSQPLQLARARGLFAHVEADPSDHSEGLKLDALLTCFRMFWIWVSG
jgi:hypothetical protein